MYDNSHYKDPLKAVERALKDAKIGIEWINEAIEQKTKELEDKRSRLKMEEIRRDKLEKYLKE